MAARGIKQFPCTGKVDLKNTTHAVLSSLHINERSTLQVCRIIISHDSNCYMVCILKKMTLILRTCFKIHIHGAALLQIGRLVLRIRNNLLKEQKLLGLYSYMFSKNCRASLMDPPIFALVFQSFVYVCMYIQPARHSTPGPLTCEQKAEGSSTRLSFH